MLTILAGVATWEREIMLERQREGIAKAKGEGKYKGRPANIDAAEIKRLTATMGPAAIAKHLGVASASLPGCSRAVRVTRLMRPMPAPGGRRMMRFSVTALLGLATSIAAVVRGSVAAVTDQDQPAAFAPAKTSKERLSGASFRRAARG